MEAFTTNHPLHERAFTMTFTAFHNELFNHLRDRRVRRRVFRDIVMYATLVLAGVDFASIWLLHVELHGFYTIPAFLAAWLPKLDEAMVGA